MKTVGSMKDMGIVITPHLERAGRCAVAIRMSRGELFRFKSVLSCTKSAAFTCLHTTWSAACRLSLVFKLGAACLEMVWMESHTISSSWTEEYTKGT